MTVQDMDICLNISAEPSAERFRKKKDKGNSLGNTAERLKTESLGINTVGNADRKQNASTVESSGKRVKQKSLSAIVAKRLSQGSVNQSRIIGKQSKPKKESVELKDSQWQTVKSSIVSNKSNVHSSDPSSNEGRNKSVTSDIQFVKLSKESLGKTILAKRRDVSKGERKKSLSNIFSKSNVTDDKSATVVSTMTQKADKDKGIILAKEPDKKVKQDKILFNTKDVNKISFKERKIKSHKDKTESKIKSDARGKFSSLFGNNPEIPNIGQRLVKPVNEPVFAKIDFSDLDIHPYMISNLEQNMQITKMTTVQQKAIPQILSGKDILIRSQTGSGKTLAYALPIVEVLQKIRPKLNRTSGLKALVVVPSRELALQTYECFLKLTKPFTWIVPGYLTGGEKRKAEKARLRRGCNILVVTPGRLLDHVRHTEALKLIDVKYLILDEADRMLDMGYEKDVSEIVNALKASVVTQTTDTGYDAMQIFKQTVKKVTTEEEIDSEEQKVVEEQSSFKCRRKKFSAENSGIDHGKSETPKNKKKQTYHSGTDSESEEEDFPVKSKKTNKRGIVLENDGEKSLDKKSTGNDDITESSNRQTILLSATLTQAVEKLAGLTMQNPIFVDAAKENLEISNGDVNDVNEDLIVPQSVVQSYIVTPPKLRMVTLSAYIAGKCQSSGQHKIVVFMATQDMVDYHMEILSSILTKPEDEEDEDSDPLVDVEFFKLCGSMTQRERTDVFKTFRCSRSGVLLCTDVAARGLDLPKVDCVIQYTGPLSTRDYVHRIGRTARAGSSGFATIFLTPPEIEFVRLLESRRIRIKQEDMNDVLDKLLGPLSKNHSSQVAAISLQQEFETLVIEDKKLREKAYKAYLSWIRFYSSYPRDMRQIFDRRKLHLGHYAKSFALRDPPQRIGGIGKVLREKDTKPQHENRLTNKRYDDNGEADGGVSQKKRQQRRNQDDERRTGLLKRVRMLNTSEYGSGLEPAKKPKKS